MIDLSSAQSGQFGRAGMFSDLYASALFQKFTGGILVKTPKDAAVFFRGGAPVHAGGAGFDKHFLGELLMRKGACTQSQLVQALDKQTKAQGAKPLLGAILVADAGVDPKVIKEMIVAQTEARVLSLFATTEGTWQSAPGENARIKEIGVLASGSTLLIAGLRGHASEQELRAASDAVLGKAVQLTKAFPELAELGLDDAEKKALRYLDKPRKPDQLERASSRRTARVLLRLLLMFDKLTIHAVAKAIPIPRATLLKGQTGFQSLASAEEEAAAKEPPAEQVPRARAPTPPPRPAEATIDPAQKALIEEVRALHGAIEKQSYFELLGITEQTPVAELRKHFTTLAKKYHPDAFPGGLSEELERMVREVSAKMNEAYQALSNERSRAEYIALLADDRFKGDSRKAERVRDAEVKHQMGIVMLRKRDYQKAREYFNFAIQSDPDCGEYKASFAWAMFIDSKFDREEALAKGYALLLEALKQSDVNAQTHFYTGQILKAKNQLREAMFHFQVAAKLDPKHADALREIRLMEMRAAKETGEDEKHSSLSKLFKR